jgi:hypothetical protein
MSKYLRIAWEPRWPSLAIGFYRRKWYRDYTFTIIIWAVVVEVGDLSDT